jgi:hypothetical protein
MRQPVSVNATNPTSLLVRNSPTVVMIAPPDERRRGIHSIDDAGKRQGLVPVSRTFCYKNTHTTGLRRTDCRITTRYSEP